MLRKFKVVLEHELDGGYSVHVPSLPGCTSQGETVKEALVNIKEALELYLWSLKEDGLSLPRANGEVILREVAIPA